MSHKKRSRDGANEDSPNTRDHLACDQCRIKKIRCGKERPNCANCNRMNLECNWSGQGKKPNQTVMLNKSISTIGERLRLIEGNIHGMQRSLQRLDSALLSRAGSVHDDESALALKHEDGAFASSTPKHSSSVSGSSSSCLSDTSPFRHHVVRDAQGYERCVGPTSLLSLVHNIDDMSMPESEGAGSNTAAARESIRELGYSASQTLITNINDGSTIKEPPILILEALIDPYFDSINPNLPIWTRDGFRRLLEASRADSSPSNNKPFAICANNMILLTLTARTLHSRARSSSSPSLDAITESIDVELVQSFISNASRAMVQVEQLVSPRLVNVQALLSLCFVAQLCLSEDIFSLTLTLAAHVARSMGLYEPQALSSQNSRLRPEDIVERRNVLQCLYYLDKAVCWNIGSSPTISVEAMMATGNLNMPQDISSLMDAKFALTQIEDDAYTMLYSKNAVMQEQGSTRTRSIQARLRAWRATCHLDEQDVGVASHFPPYWRLELEIAYHYARMRLLGPFVEETDARASIFEDFRASLRLLQQLWEVTAKHDHCPSFAWLVISFPPTATLHIISHLEDAQFVRSDLDLLSFLATSLENVSIFATKNSFVTRFASFVRILAQLAQDLVDGKKSSASPESGFINLFPLPAHVHNFEREGDGDQQHTYDGKTSLFPGAMQDSLHPREDLDSLMTMWENTTDSFNSFTRGNDLMGMHDFSTEGSKGMWDFNITGNQSHHGMET